MHVIRTKKGDQRYGVIAFGYNRSLTKYNKKFVGGTKQLSKKSLALVARLGKHVLTVSRITVGAVVVAQKLDFSRIWVAIVAPFYKIVNFGNNAQKGYGT